jgi:hypothetical protein
VVATTPTVTRTTSKTTGNVTERTRAGRAAWCVEGTPGGSVCRLYNKLVDLERLCPMGWRVPTEADWAELIRYYERHDSDPERDGFVGGRGWHVQGGKGLTELQVRGLATRALGEAECGGYAVRLICCVPVVPVATEVRATLTVAVDYEKLQVGENMETFKMGVERDVAAAAQKRPEDVKVVEVRPAASVSRSIATVTAGVDVEVRIVERGESKSTVSAVMRAVGLIAEVGGAAVTAVQPIGAAKVEEGKKWEVGMQMSNLERVKFFESTVAVARGLAYETRVVTAMVDVLDPIHIVANVETNRAAMRQWVDHESRANRAYACAEQYGEEHSLVVVHGDADDVGFAACKLALVWCSANGAPRDGFDQTHVDLATGLKGLFMPGNTLRSSPIESDAALEAAEQAEPGARANLPDYMQKHIEGWRAVLTRGAGALDAAKAMHVYYRVWCYLSNIEDAEYEAGPVLLTYGAVVCELIRVTAIAIARAFSSGALSVTLRPLTDKLLRATESTASLLQEAAWVDTNGAALEAAGVSPSAIAACLRGIHTMQTPVDGWPTDGARLDAIEKAQPDGASMILGEMFYNVVADDSPLLARLALVRRAGLYALSARLRSAYVSLAAAGPVRPSVYEHPAFVGARETAWELASDDPHLVEVTSLACGVDYRIPPEHRGEVWRMSITTADEARSMASIAGAEAVTIYSAVVGQVDDDDFVALYRATVILVERLYGDQNQAPPLTLALVSVVRVEDEHTAWLGGWESSMVDTLVVDTVYRVVWKAQCEEDGLIADFTDDAIGHAPIAGVQCRCIGVSGSATSREYLVVTDGRDSQAFVSVRDVSGVAQYRRLRRGSPYMPVDPVAPESTVEFTDGARYKIVGNALYVNGECVGGVTWVTESMCALYDDHTANRWHTLLFDPSGTMRVCHTDMVDFLPTPTAAQIEACYSGALRVFTYTHVNGPTTQDTEWMGGLKGADEPVAPVVPVAPVAPVALRTVEFTDGARYKIVGNDLYVNGELMSGVDEDGDVNWHRVVWVTDRMCALFTHAFRWHTLLFDPSGTMLVCHTKLDDHRNTPTVAQIEACYSGALNVFTYTHVNGPYYAGSPSGWGG